MHSFERMEGMNKFYFIFKAGQKASPRVLGAIAFCLRDAQGFSRAVGPKMKQE